MASGVPASLKTADVNRFALRAAQIEKAKPAVAYWCNYWIVQQIVMKSLHNTDEESKLYTSSLMDKLEQMKLENAEDDAITDDVAGKALIEQFGLDVFKKAENAMRANKATRQTADTFLASATFLDLLQIWPPIDTEISAKIKFAKYHALRIAKALKSGEDPNASNPVQEPSPAQEVAPLDPDDPEVKAIEDLGPNTDSAMPPGMHATVEDVPDEHDRISSSLARTSTLDESLHPSRAPSTPRPDPATTHVPAEDFYQSTEHEEVSPLGPESADQAPPSVGGGYFPRVTDDEASMPPDLPQPPDSHVHSFESNNAGAPHHSERPLEPPSPPVAPPQLPPQVPFNQPTPHQASYVGLQRGAPPPTTQPNFVPDEDAIAKAQKHARWAISALNFEDVKTAISELEGALQTLGAR